MKCGDIACVKSLEHREVVSVAEDKRGKQKVTANRYGFKFQSEHNQLSQVGVLIFLDVYPESVLANDEAMDKFVEFRLNGLGWGRGDAT